MPSARSPCSKSITDKRMRRICSFTDFYSVLLDFLRLSGAMILTDYLLLESIQHRIGANKIRVRFTTEFFFEHGFIGFNGCLLRYRYCLPDSFTWCTNNPETSSRVTLASLGIVFQTKVVEMAISLRWGVDLAVSNLCISTEEQNHLATKVCFYSVKRLQNCQ